MHYVRFTTTGASKFLHVQPASLENFQHNQQHQVPPASYGCLSLSLSLSLPLPPSINLYLTLSLSLSLGALLMMEQGPQHVILGPCYFPVVVVPCPAQSLQLR